jgi:hypothetical protein
LNCTIPALVSSKVGSPRGIKEELGTISCPFSLKKLKNAVRISSPVIIHTILVQPVLGVNEKLFIKGRLRRLFINLTPFIPLSNIGISSLHEGEE